MEPTKEDLQTIRSLHSIKAFKLWKEMVVDANIQTLDAELASTEADNMPEHILRAKLKFRNSLQYFFKDVFEQLDAQIELENNKETENEKQS